MHCLTNNINCLKNFLRKVGCGKYFIFCKKKLCLCEFVLLLLLFPLTFERKLEKGFKLRMQIEQAILKTRCGFYHLTPSLIRPNPGVLSVNM